MWTVFLSHSSEDKEFVERLAADLDRRGISVWYDDWELKVGDSLRERVSEGIHKSSYFAVVVSEASSQSKWVKQELNQAFARHVEAEGNFILPVVVDSDSVPDALTDLVYADFSKEYSSGLDRLLRTIGKSPTTGEQAEVALSSKGDRIFFARQHDYVGILISNVWDGLVEFEDAANAALRDARDTVRKIVGQIVADFCRAGSDLGTTSIDSSTGMKVNGHGWAIESKWELANEEPAVYYTVVVRIAESCPFLKLPIECPFIVPPILRRHSWTETGVEVVTDTQIDELVHSVATDQLTLRRAIPGPTGELVFQSELPKTMIQSTVKTRREVELSIVAGGDRLTIAAKPSWHIREELDPHLLNVWRVLGESLRTENALQQDA
jgi:hypothetical protein